MTKSRVDSPRLLRCDSEDDVHRNITEQPNDKRAESSSTEAFDHKRHTGLSPNATATAYFPIEPTTSSKHAAVNCRAVERRKALIHDQTSNRDRHGRQRVETEAITVAESCWRSSARADT